MKQGWEIKKLGEVCTIQTGKLDANAKVEEGAYPFYTCDSQPYRIDTYAFDDEAILISGNGSQVGHVNYYKGKFNAYQRTYVLTKFSSFDIPFLIKYLKGYLRGYLWDNKKGGCIPYITLPILKNFQIPCPPLPEQEKIVSELNCLSGIIEKKRQQLKELDALAQSIFYEMFGNPVDNERGWEVSSIESLCSSIVRGPFGSALKKDFFVEPSSTTYKVYEQKHAIQKDSRIGTYYISAERFKTLSRFEVTPGDIIMSCSGTIGEFYEIPIDAEKGVMNQALLKFTLSNSIEKVYFLYTMEWVKDNFDKKGTGLQNIGSVGTIKKTNVALPPLPLQQTFAQKIEAIEQQKALIKQSIAEVETLFNARMQEYFE